MELSYFFIFDSEKIMTNVVTMLIGMPYTLKPGMTVGHLRGNIRRIQIKRLWKDLKESL